MHAGAVRQAGRREVGAQHQRGERVDIRAMEGGPGEALAGRHQIAPRPRTGIDDADRVSVVRGPPQHRLDDRARRVGLAERTALLGGADRAVGVPQRVLAPPDHPTHPANERRSRPGAVRLVDQPPLGGAQIAGVLGAEREGQGHQGGDGLDIHAVQSLRRHRHQSPSSPGRAGTSLGSRP